MADTEKSIRMYSTTWCKDCHFAKRWFDAHHIAYENIDVEQDEQAAEYVRQVNNGRRTIPTIVFPDGSILVEPDANQLAAKFPALASKAE
jgi:Glutaredoxin-like protein